METFLNVMHLEEPWKSQTEIDKMVLQTYLDPAFLPKSGNGNQQTAKKTKKDVEAYRIRHVQGIFGCIMASYGSGHELPEQNLRRFGLYGTLLAQASGLRFLAIPEIAIAHSALMPFWLPMDQKLATRILGNAIAIPHALLGVTNAMAFLSGMTGVEIQELMLEAMTKRFTSQNIRWEIKWGGFSFTKDDDACQPTQLMHSHQKITVFSPTDRFTFFAERGTRVWDAIRTLTGPSIPQEIFLLPAGLNGSKGYTPTQLRSHRSGDLTFCSSSFSTRHRYGTFCFGYTRFFMHCSFHSQRDFCSSTRSGNDSFGCHHNPQSPSWVQMFAFGRYAW
jgi:uncharacterized membrane protein